MNVSESRIKDIHKAIMHEDDPALQAEIGVWKKSDNYLYNYKGERIDFAPFPEVPERMHQLIKWLNAQKEKIARKSPDALHPVELAFRFHIDFVTIHPFYDGNGRTARIVTNIILISFGYPPMYVKTDEKTQYGMYLSDVQVYGGDLELFLGFMGEALIRSLEMVRDGL